MTSRTLHIHIGCHKTGTTSIQHHLAQNVEALQARGLVFFYENRFSGTLQLPDLHSWLAFADPQRIVPHGLHLAEPERLLERLAQVGGDVVLSSENFSFFFEQANIDALQRHLSGVFGQIRIICYLRRQDRHIVSHHQEGAKLERYAEYDLFGHSTRAIPPFDPRHELYLDYDRRLSMWARAFGDENLVIRIFDRKSLRNGDVVDDFFHLIGVEDYRKIGDRNISRGLQDIKIGHIVSGSDLKHKHALVRLTEAAAPDERRMLPSRAAARAYYAHYLPGNAALNARFGIAPGESLFDEDFSDYPEVAGDEWTEYEANAVILRLLRIIDESYAELTPDELRDAALGIGNARPEIAVKLLRVARMLRPEGALIQRKLAEFESLLEQRQS